MLLCSLSPWLLFGACLASPAWKIGPDGEAFEPGQNGDLTAWEQKPGLFEGDIKLARKEKPPMEADVNEFNARRGQQWRWPGGVIPFVFNASSNYSFLDKQIILGAIRDYQSYTCLRWLPWTGQTNYISIFSEDGCYSYVGLHREGVQQLSLQKDDGTGTCITHGIAQHEMMHASGFYHEQSRTDRDNYIAIEWNNIRKGYAHNFQKYSTNQVSMMGVRYDYGSIMHYDTTAFSVNRTYLDTIEVKTPGAVIGQRRGFSSTDQLKLNKYYGCPVPYNAPGPMDGFASPWQCSFDANWCGWSQDYKVALDGSSSQWAATDDDFDWLLNDGPTPSGRTGPVQDHTSTRGRYVYMEASSPRVAGDVARLRTPWAAAGGGGLFCVSFYYNMFAVNAKEMGSLRVYVLDSSLPGRRLLWTRTGAQNGSPQQWLQGQFQYRASPNARFRVLFEGVVGPTYQSDIALDDFRLYKGACGSVVSTMGDPLLCTFEAGNCGYAAVPSTPPQRRLFSWQLQGGAVGFVRSVDKADSGRHYLAAAATFPLMFGAASAVASAPVRLNGTGVGCLRFDHLASLTASAELNVYLRIGATQTAITSVSASTSVWTTLKTGLNIQSGVPFQVVFEAVRGLGPLPDYFALDFVRVSPGPC